MEKSEFYIKDLSGQKIWLFYDEINSVRKDILLFFDENNIEPVNLYLPSGQFPNEYWKYLTFNFDKKYAESEQYKRLIVDGSLAVLNGICADILDEPISSIVKTWNEISIEKEILPYLHNYVPETDKLKIAKEKLVYNFEFICKLTANDLDENGCLKTDFMTQSSKWFNENIIKDYYRRNAAT
jgi:hypothetical protein